MEDFSFMYGLSVSDAMQWNIDRLWVLVTRSNIGNVVSPIVNEYAENNDLDPYSAANSVLNSRLKAIDFWSKKLKEINKKRKGKIWTLIHLIARFLPDSLNPLKRRLNQE